jgi:predicted ATPase
MLRSVRLNPSDHPPSTGHPFDLPALRGVEEIEFRERVTFLVGENGSGKSTVLEALAVATELPTLGSAPAHRDPTLAIPARLAAAMRMGWSPRLRRGFFIRAEDVFGFILALRRQRAEIERELEELSRRMEGASDYARGLALGPHRGSLADMTRRYGENPDARSHGETFLHLFRERFAPGGLYLMDEPEAALSPQSQLALVAMMADAVRSGGQFIVATHSPILLAIPGAARLSFDTAPLSTVDWAELDSVRLWQDLLAGPERFMRHIWGDAE